MCEPICQAFLLLPRLQDRFLDNGRSESPVAPRLVRFLAWSRLGENIVCLINGQRICRRPKERLAIIVSAKLVRSRSARPTYKNIPPQIHMASDHSTSTDSVELFEGSVIDEIPIPSGYWSESRGIGGKIAGRGKRKRLGLCRAGRPGPERTGLCLM